MHQNVSRQANLKKSHNTKHKCPTLSQNDSPQTMYLSMSHQHILNCDMIPFGSRNVLMHVECKPNPWMNHHFAPRPEMVVASVSCFNLCLSSSTIDPVISLSSLSRVCWYRQACSFTNTVDDVHHVRL